MSSVLAVHDQRFTESRLGQINSNEHIASHDPRADGRQAEASLTESVNTALNILQVSHWQRYGTAMVRGHSLGPVNESPAADAMNEEIGEEGGVEVVIQCRRNTHLAGT